MNRHVFALFVVVTVGVLAGGCGYRPSEPLAAQGTPQTRTYFVAADDVVWDYAPSGSNKISGKPFEGFEIFVTTATPMTLGRVYKKTVFHEYTDETFTRIKPRAAEWEHLGILGPLIRAEVGDTIKVIFRNNAQHPHSLHPHGVFYEKASEGAQYDD